MDPEPKQLRARVCEQADWVAVPMLTRERERCRWWSQQPVSGFARRDRPTAGPQETAAACDSHPNEKRLLRFPSPLTKRASSFPGPGWLKTARFLPRDCPLPSKFPYDGNTIGRRRIPNVNISPSTALSGLIQLVASRFEQAKCKSPWFAGPGERKERIAECWNRRRPQSK